MDEIDTDMHLQQNENEQVVESNQLTRKHYAVVIISLVFIVLSLLGYIFLQNKNQKTPIESHQRTPTIISTTTMVPTIEASSSPYPLDQEAFSKRVFGINGNSHILGENPYQNELSSLKDSELVGLNCLPRYYRDNDGQYIIYNQEAHSYPKTLQEPELIRIIQSNDSIGAITACTTENGKTLLLYELPGAGGGGAGHKVAVAYIYNDSIVDPIVIEQNYEDPYAEAYFACYGGPIMLTTDNIFYFSCGGGRIQTVFAANLDDGSFRVVNRCKEELYDENGEALPKVCR